ncbi:MAG: hypothetical protein JRI78_12010 [Deltaproteobacteria bacterium]|nr:hypothetical protein [Deltaproteobacteria bacterium]
MNIIYKAYNFLITGFFFVFSPPFWLYSRITGRYRDGIHQRLGFYPKSVVDRISGSPKIWLHAASVGEVSAAVAIIESLKRLIPHCAIILSTTTEHGQTSARDKLQSKATCVYAPIDFIVSVRKALSTIRPDILVCLETEIWPNWLFEARRMGVRLALVNGRISVRSIKGYLKIRCLIREALRQVESFSMIREADAQRLMMLGVPREKIVVNGNAKFDLLLPMADASIKGEIEKFYNLNGNIPVFVAGSTRGSEHEIVVDVYEKILETLPETLLIIAPRHLERVRYIKDMVIRRGFSCQFKTDIDKPGGFRTASVVIMDTIGDLQSILEAAVWGKPVLYGPSMDDFLDAKALLDKTGGGIQVKDGRELTERALYYLTHPAEADAVGRLAKEAVMLNKGAADNHADVICRLLNPNLS